MDYLLGGAAVFRSCSLVNKPGGTWAKPQEAVLE
jgi:hypothetical protein